MTNSQYEQYRGKRALILLRVSTEEQEKKFGFPSQLAEIRKKILDTVGLIVDEERHIVRDTYTGLEFREREVLAHILEMAKRREFDIVVMDKLDRLGRKGIQREIYRGLLREQGVRILTTDPNEHADDDSLIGEMIRLLHGFKAEEELNDIRRRTMNGKRAKVEGKEDGVTKKLIGSGTRLYGYKWTYSTKGKREGYELNLDVLMIDEDSIEWTEVKVVTFVFKSSSEGMTIRDICRYLNSRGIPASKGGLWQPATIGQMLRKRAYTGEATMFQERSLEKIPGKKSVPREKRPESEQIKVSIPQIIDLELFEQVQKGLSKNKAVATRNNKHPHESLLRAGYVKCGYCGCNMSFQKHLYTRKSGTILEKRWYQCSTGYSSLGRCVKCTIDVRTLDDAAWQFALEIIRNPSQVDQRIKELTSDDPTQERRKQITNKLAEIYQRQTVLRKRLTELKLDAGTEEFLSTQLKQLANDENSYQSELANDDVTYARWQELQAKVKELHQFCKEMQEHLDDPEYNPSYQKKRETIEFFGIIAHVWKPDHEPRFELECKPPDIVSLLSSSRNGCRDRCAVPPQRAGTRVAAAASHAQE
ncbi:MAG TPA: recombinase family protein [Ktedonobacteraceae bacterium]|nr:recombinase family protein [Ktedonobacteraceae bacterium]